MYAVHVDAGVAGTVLLGLLEARGATAPPAGGPLDEAIDATVAELRSRHGESTAGQIEHLQPARELYRAIGLDPTKRRPSPEALLRRLLRGDPFPRVHPAVDLANLWAIVHGLPVGLYDIAKLNGPATVRLGREDESYEGIRKAEVHLGGRLLLADGHGPFGNPSSDSLRTCVDERSRDLLFVLFAPARHDRDDVTRWLDWLRVRIEPWFAADVETGLA